jgi:DNA-binding NarL/FixJ family response regulator
LAKVVGMSNPESELEIIAYAEAGVSSFVAAEDSLADLIVVLRRTAQGEVLCSPRVAATLLNRLRMLTPANAGDARARLTSRELQIIELIDEGLPNKQIARRLSIQPSTVKNHVHKILEKLDASCRSEAAARVMGKRVGRLRGG